MAAGTLDLDIEQGATFRRQIVWRHPSADGGMTPGAPRDLTGCTAKLQIRTNAGADPLVTLVDGDGITLGGIAGTIGLHISDERTATLTVRRARYDLYIYWPGGDATRLLEGRVNIDFAMTRAGA